METNLGNFKQQNQIINYLFNPPTLAILAQNQVERNIFFILAVYNTIISWRHLAAPTLRAGGSAVAAERPVRTVKQLAAAAATRAQIRPPNGNSGLK